jgi:type IV pilus assembly protein PilM
MRATRILAVDLGAGHVACGVFGISATGRLVLQRFALEPQGSDPAHEAGWTENTARALVALATREQLGGACALAIPGHLALTKFIKTPALDPAKRVQSLTFEASQHIPYPLADVVWDHVVIADDGFDLEVMLAAAKFDALESLCAAADAAGFAPERATPGSLALRAAFRYSYPDAPASALVINIGARSTHLLFLDGERFYIRTFPLAGNTVTTSIAEELHIDFAAADTLKISVLSGRSELPDNSPARAAVHRAATVFITRFHPELTRSILNHRRQTGAPAPAAVYVTGGGSLIEELPATLAERLKLPVERYDPLRGVEISADARAAGAASHSQVMAELVGLAVSLVQPVADATLLPPAITGALAFRKRQPLLLVAALLAAAALVPPILYFHTRALRAGTQLAATDAQLRPLRSVEARNNDHLAQIEEARKQVAALEGLVATKANWLDFLSDVQTRLAKVGDVWLERIQLVQPPAPDAAVAPAPAVEAAAGAPVAAIPLKLAITGRLLDVANPVSNVSPESYERVKKLIASFTGSPFVATVENERFDNTQPGLLRFDFTLVVNATRPL